MTDVHSHLIFNVDDGSTSIEESIELLKRMKDVGFDNVIITPHFISDTEYSSSNKLKLIRLEEIRKELKEKNIDINVYLGNEIYINNRIDKLIEEGEIYPLNNSKYLLIELPMHNVINNFEDILYELKCKGYEVVIAHPERYSYFQENPYIIKSLFDDGYLFQCNYSSIIGYYGNDAEKTLKYMLKNRYVHYLGTDIHRLNRTFVLDNFNEIKNTIIKLVGEDYFNEIMSNSDNLVGESDGKE